MASRMFVHTRIVCGRKLHREARELVSWNDPSGVAAHNAGCSPRPAMASIRTPLRSPVAGFAGNATPAAVPATMGCTSTASRLRLGSGGLARRIPSSALARAATRLPQHIWIAIKRRSKSSPTSTDSSLRAIPWSAQSTSSIRIATGSRLHARSSCGAGRRPRHRCLGQTRCSNALPPVCTRRPRLHLVGRAMVYTATMFSAPQRHIATWRRCATPLRHTATAPQCGTATGGAHRESAVRSQSLAQQCRP